MLEIKNTQVGSHLVLELKGTIDETIRLDQIDLSNAVEISVSCRHIARINSMGVRAWQAFFSSARAMKKKLRFKELPSVLLTQANIFTGLIQASECESVCMAMLCEKCGHEKVDVVPVAGLTLNDDIWVAFIRKYFPARVRSACFHRNSFWH